MSRVEGPPILLPLPESSEFSEFPVLLPDGGNPERRPKRPPEKDLRLSPLLIRRGTEEYRRIKALPGLGRGIKYDDEDGTIHLSIWREIRQVSEPEKYDPISKLRKGWELEPTLRIGPKKSIAEPVFHRIEGDGGSVETAIRNVDHVLDKYRFDDEDLGKEVKQVRVLQNQVNQALDVLAECSGPISSEEFDEGFDILHTQTLRILSELGMEKVILEVKKQLNDLVERGTRGKNGLDRRNPQAMLWILEAAQKRAEWRMETIRAIRRKFIPMQAVLTEEREQSREILKDVQKEMGNAGLAGHEVFIRHPEKGTTPLQRGVLKSKLETTIRQLLQIKLKPYRPVAQELIDCFKRAQSLVEEGKYREAKKIFDSAQEKATAVLDEYKDIYPEKDES